MHGVRNEQRSLYEILGVPADATSQQIERAYQRFKREQQRETTPPDQRLRVMIEHAHDVLMDPVRREQYDNDSGARMPRMIRGKRGRVRIAAGVAALAAAGAGTWFWLDREPPRQAHPEVNEALAMATGRLVRIEPNGAKTPLGMAFAIAEGTLATSCEGITPVAELVVEFGKRAAPVRAAGIDEATQLCKLAGGTVGSWPLTLSNAAPQPGQHVYVVGTRGTSLQVKEATYGKLAARPEDLGAPLLDDQGRVAAALSRVGGVLAYVQVPRAWTITVPDTVIYSPPEPKAKAVEAPPAAGPDITPERREKLEKAFRPPIKVPSDL